MTRKYGGKKEAKTGRDKGRESSIYINVKKFKTPRISRNTYREETLMQAAGVRTQVAGVRTQVAGERGTQAAGVRAQVAGERGTQAAGVRTQVARGEDRGGRGEDRGGRGDGGGHWS